MNRETQNRMRDMLENGSADELVPGFDKAALWSRIEPRVQRRSVLRIARPWLSHAAAVAAGLLLAWIVLPRGEGGVGNTPAGLHQSASTVAAGDERSDTLLKSTPAGSPALGEAKTNGTTVAQAAPRPRKIRSNEASQDNIGSSEHSQKPALTVEKVSTDPYAKEDSERTAITPVLLPTASTGKIFAKQPAPVVVHLLDVTGESGERLRRPVEPLPGRRVGFFARLLSRNKVPDLTGSAASDAVVQRTYLSR